MRVDPTPATTTLAGTARATELLNGEPIVTVTHRVAATAGSGRLTVMRIDLTHAHLNLHSGFLEPTTTGGWTYGSTITRAESAHVLAAFNSGFKGADSGGGWRSQGRTVLPLVQGVASVVLYADGGVDIGAWGTEVPQAHRRVISVRQNRGLLVDRRHAQDDPSVSYAASVQRWGVIYAGARLAARSGLGVTADHHLIYVAGTGVTVHDISQALLAEHVVRGMELDINAPLVRAFLIPGVAGVEESSPSVGGLTQPIPLVIGQTQPAGTATIDQAPHCTYFQPCSRDFFTVVAS